MDRGRADGPFQAPGSAGLHGSHFRGEVAFLHLDSFPEGVSGESPDLHVLADLAGGLLDQFGNGDRTVLDERLLQKRQLDVLVL